MCDIRQSVFLLELQWKNLQSSIPQLSGKCLEQLLSPLRVSRNKSVLMRSIRVQIFELGLIVSEIQDYIPFEINAFEDYTRML